MSLYQLIFILNMIRSGPRVTFSYDSVNCTRIRVMLRLWIMLVISPVMTLMMTA